MTSASLKTTSYWGHQRRGVARKVHTQGPHLDRSWTPRLSPRPRADFFKSMSLTQRSAGTKAPYKAARQATSGRHARRRCKVNPRKQNWKRHFCWESTVLVGMTISGKVTVQVLNINEPSRGMLRENLLFEEWLVFPFSFPGRGVAPGVRRS